MKQRVSTDSWSAFVAGLLVFNGLFLIAFWLPSLISLFVSKEYPTSFRDVMEHGEALLLAAGSLFIGIRLLLGRGCITVAIAYMAVWIVLTLVHNGILLRRTSFNDLALLSLVMGLASQIATLFLLIYIRARAKRET